jgi:polar amino acid transport system substrate-binding protein
MASRILLLLLLSLSVARADTIRLAFNALEPWKIYDAQGHASGAYVEIAQELAKRLGDKLEIVECPLKRCLVYLQNGEADMSIGLQQTPERLAYLHFLQAPYRLHAADKVFYMRRREAWRLQKARDLESLNLGVRLGSTLDDKLSSEKQLHVESVVDNRVNLQKLMIGRLDAVGVPEDQGEFLLATMHLEGALVKASYREVDATPRSVAIARKSLLAAKLPQFEAAMQAMREDGTLRRIYQQQYFQRFGIKDSAIRIE